MSVFSLREKFLKDLHLSVAKEILKKQAVLFNKFNSFS